MRCDILYGMISPFVFFLFLVWLSFCFAKVEIAIEGDNGWAGGLPTWRFPSTNWASLLFFNGRPITGYHVWMETFILSGLHFVYAFVEPTWHIELQIIAFFLFFTVLEDFLWFVLNPAFGLHKFKKENIWWHRDNWWLIAPREYFTLVPFGAALYALSWYVAGM